MTRVRYREKKSVAGRSMRGLMLMEVIVSMMVLSVGIVAVSRSFSVALQARGLAQDYTDARFLASSRLATAVANARAGQTGAEQGGFGPDWPRFSCQTTVSQSQFAYNRIVTQRGVQSAEDIEDITDLQPMSFGQVVVTVKWTRRNEEFSRTVSALVPPLGETEREGLFVE